MYNLGDNFKIPTATNLPKEECVYKGEHYRFTILSERLIRLEYSIDGVFEDRPTEFAWNREFDAPKFVVREDDRYIEIKTAYFVLSYTKNAPFYGGKFNHSGNLKVDISNSDNKYWYFGHPEVRNYGAPGLFLGVGKKKKLMKSLYSIDGFVSFNDSDSQVFNENGELVPREHKNTDIYLFVYLKDFDLALKDYYKLTGAPALIPRYALGNWWQKNEAYTDEDIRQLITTAERKDIPMSILLLDKDWHKRIKEGKNHLKTGFSFNNEYFKDPAGMIKYLNSKGVRLGLSVNPTEGIYSIDNYFEKAKEYLPADATGKIPFNIYDSKFIDVYLKLFIHPLDALGVDFYWIDYFNKDKSDELFRLKHYHFYDMMRDYKRRPMVLGYNSFMTPHRYPVLYSGKTEVSWDTLKAIPVHNADAANLGVSWWSHDIGGYFKGTEDNELYTRFVQLGVFSPIMKFGADWGKYYKREPWKWNIKTYVIAKEYLQLRHRLIPYLYSEAYKYSTQGIPLVQPLYYKFPEMYDDPIYRNEYYFGGELYVSPIISKKDYVMNRTIHKFYIPEGTWYDITTGKKFPGGKSYVSFFREQDYPVFARGGAIIPMSNDENLNDTTPPKNLEVQIYPGRSNTYKLYEDDGLSDLYKKGFYLLTSIDYNYLPNNYTVIFRALEGKSGIVPEKRNYTIRFRNTKKANDVIVYFNNNPIPNNAYVDGTDFVVEIKDVPTIGQLTINCKGTDIEFDAVRLVNEDIENILSDLPIETLMKEKVDEVLFSDLPIKKKRIAVRRLKRKGLERKFVKLFLKLLEYVEQV
ncbi:MAG: DUF5110 domain-containing protein [Bacilli bacterium]|nr:DUF5110 domain-containing protein [Bacilli bacterium]